MSTEMYRVGFSRFFTETFDDYRDVESAMMYFTGEGKEFTVQRSDGKNDWQTIARPYDYRAPGRNYVSIPGPYDCDHCGLVGGH